MVTAQDYMGDSIEALFGGDDQPEVLEAVAEETTEQPAKMQEAATESDAPGQSVEQPTEATDIATIAKPPTVTDEHYFDQLDLLAKMAECERKRQEIESELAEVDAERKELKAKLKSCEIDMKEIAADIRDLMANTYIPERKAFAADPAPKSETPGQADPVASVESNDWGDGQWREAKTAEVMDGVKGLGKKKLEVLSDLAPTIGQLEDLRGTSGGVFKTVLPQGFGDKVASEIEERLLEYVRRHDTPPASEQVKLNVIVAEDETDTNVPLEVVVGYVESFRNDAEIEKWDATDCDLDKETVANQCSPEMEAGYMAKKSGEPIESYPETFTHGELSDWAYGYVCREVMERIESAGKNVVDAFDDL